MNRRILSSIILPLAFMVSAKAPDVTLTIVHTTDVHGNFFPRDYINRTDASGSLARVNTYVDSLRASLGRDNVILVDAGDILQGQPTVYYYNFIDTVTPHVAARVYNFMGYDAVTVGNHDIETGHSVYDRFNKLLDVHLSAANVIDTGTSLPYFTPYRIVERHGIRIAFLSLLTSAIPAWLPRNLWEGMAFDDMTASARHWVDYITAHEHPDAIIGLFHSGNDASKTTGGYIENASTLIAREVPGFDAILTGHDHTRCNKVVMGPGASSVTIINPANNADAVGRIDLTFSIGDDGRPEGHTVKGTIVEVDSLDPSPAFLARFAADMDTIEAFTSRIIGRSLSTASTRDSYFGPSAFIDLIHSLQLKISGADISMAAPLAFDATINAGDIRVSDMFNLYKYENLLYVMQLTGQEIKDYLEESYSLWTRQMAPGDTHILNWATDTPSARDNRLLNPAYNFDSAAGIDYTVDVTKPKGQKINIIRLTDGRPFSPDSTYSVAVNSYRGNGGGDLLTSGAGIPREQLADRITFATDRDMRYYLMQEIIRLGTIDPKPAANWSFIPAEIAGPAITTDRAILFPSSAKIQQH